MSNPKSLVEVMQALRAPDGCPWDLEQDHQSLKPYLIEECYECLEAIDQSDDDHLKEELGDVLLQVVFHAQIASERGVFDFKDVEKHICEKMIRRHPHVFGDQKVASVSDVVEQWQKIKQSEKKSSASSAMPKLYDGLPSGLPMIQKAIKVQKRAAKKGFEWSSLEGVMAKLKEELGELEEAVLENDPREIEAELGDLFFILIKASRFLNCDAETALSKTVHKFTHRFYEMEKVLNENNESMSEVGLDRLTEVWNAAKIHDPKN